MKFLLMIFEISTIAKVINFLERIIIRHFILQSIILLVFLISYKTLAQTREVLVNDVSWAPYFFIETNQEQLGIGKEILNICLPKAGYTPRYVRLPIKRTHYYMNEGKIDITVYSYKSDREKILFYAKEPLFSTEYGFVVRKNSHIKIHKLADVNAYQIGHLAGLTYSPEYLAIINKKMQLDQVSEGYSLEAMFMQLLAPKPRFDIMADSKSTLHWFAKEHGINDKIKVLDFTLKHKNYFIAISKKSLNIENPQAVLAKTDQCIKQLKKDGRYKAIMNKYAQPY